MCVCDQSEKRNHDGIPLLLRLKPAKSGHQVHQAWVRPPAQMPRLGPWSSRPIDLKPALPRSRNEQRQVKSPDWLCSLIGQTDSQYRRVMVGRDHEDRRRWGRPRSVSFTVGGKKRK